MTTLLTSLTRKLLRKTSFPSLDAEHVPELARLASEDESSDEESVVRQREKYRTKEDEDVAVFMSIARQLSTKSLIFLLQNHARTMHNIIPEVALDAALLQKRDDGAQEEQKPYKKPAISKAKLFRFATVSNDQVRAVVRVIPRNDMDEPESACWWTPEEYKESRLEAAQLARFYRKHEAAFLSSVAVLADPEASPPAVETSLKSMMVHNLSNPRGLESHMVRVLSAPRRQTVRAVLDQQELCRTLTYDEACEFLRQASLQQSASNRCFAQRMGNYDHIEALKASLSRWRTRNIDRPDLPPQLSGRPAIRAAAVRTLSRELAKSE